MKISPNDNFQIVYSILEHEFFGTLFETYIVKVSDLGKLTLQHQRISTKNVKEFESRLQPSDFELVNLIDSISIEVLFQKFSDKKGKPIDYFLKIYDKVKGNIELQEAINAYLEKQKKAILPMFFDKRIFIMGKDGEPTWREVAYQQEAAKVLFHFYRNEENTHYFPTIKYDEFKIDFQYKNAKILCNKPAWLLCEGALYHFEKDVDGKKLKPFLFKKFIEIPRRIENDFYSKFGSQIIGSFDVYAKGLKINVINPSPTAILKLSELQQSKSTPDLFNNQSNIAPESKFVFELYFKYGSYIFKSDNYNHTVVDMKKIDENYVFDKIERKQKIESSILLKLKEKGLLFSNSKISKSKSEAFGWIGINYDWLKENNIELEQLTLPDGKKYFTGTAAIDIQITENIDWFDIKAIIMFGDYKIPFYYLKDLLARKQQEFKLPNGEIAVIPEEWINKYTEVFAFALAEDKENHQIKKHHISLVANLDENSLANVTMNQKLKKLENFDQIEDVAIPVGFIGNLRPYQKEGYNWLHFLHNYKFGGCLADDMGLGKTIQTLAFLQSILEKNETNKLPSLLIAPTSLIYNWELEAIKFTPNIKILKHVGPDRSKNSKFFHKYDLILTSYGTMRSDENMLIDYLFNYIILDESQAIKNPLSNTAKAVKLLKSHHKLILTGTPIENSTMDLWSQMSFINPGLLGGMAFFRDQYQVPIEKKADQEKAQKLHAIIKPFIMRRLKANVAKDLPEKIESIRFCEMTAAQEKMYESVKAQFRNRILDHIDSVGMAQSQILLLQGLTKLRQIANHPAMIDEDYSEGSGKMDDMIYMLDEAISENHQILIFSQYVKHLAIIRPMLEAKNIQYAYLDGSTKPIDRQEQVEFFQKNTNVPVFLLSLKAGGVGLNLTAADYVFVLDPWWNPAAEAQAVDRAHRIGQKKTVFTYKYITKNTVEEKILLLQNRKRSLADGLITTDENFTKSLSKEDIRMILE